LDNDTSIIRLLIQEQSLAESLSEENFIKLLTQNISVLIHTLATKQSLIEDLIQTMRADTQLYTAQGLSLKEHLEYLKQQKSSVYELMSYLQQESSSVTNQLERIESSKSSLVDTQQRLEEIVQIAPTAGSNSALYEVLDQDDRSLDNNFYSRPFVGEPVVMDRYAKKSGSVRFELPQSTALYSPAAGVIHQVQRDKSVEL
jgi:chromosome segregation ATPase